MSPTPTQTGQADGDPQSLLARDKRYTWHPYTQHGLGIEPLQIAAGKGAELTLIDGSTIIDGISSWWATLHGHGPERLVQAAQMQMRTLDHVLFAGATHEPAVQLAQRLVEITPTGLDRVFFSDNGSSAVEIALKMVIQNFAQNGQPNRRTFIALEGAYHGDTFGAMSVGDPDPFFEAYRPLLFDSVRIAPSGSELRAALEKLGDRAAGVIVEPLLQGAAGMRVHSHEFLQAARAACTEYGIPFIADEVMTGFGRTGSLFACNRAGVTPDVMCLAKGLTGGTFPLAVTLASDAIFQGFLSTDRSRTFFHGHTFTAHPVGCAIALESLRMVLEDDVPNRFEAIGAQIRRELVPIESHPGIQNLRHLGGLVALDLVPTSSTDAGYLSNLGPRIAEISLENGVLLRPLGNVLYALPPACTSAEQASRIAHAMRDVVQRLA